MNKQYYAGYDKIIKRKQLAQLEKSIKEKEAYYYDGVLLNEQEMKLKAMQQYNEQNEMMNKDWGDLEFYISRSSIQRKPIDYKIPEFAKDL